MGLVQQAEQRDGRPYDLIVRSRPDIFWVRPHPPLTGKLWSRATDSVLVDGRVPQMDWHAVLPRAKVGLIFSLYSRYRSCQGAQAPFDVWPRFTTEAVWRRALELTAPVRKVGFAFILVRDSVDDAQQSAKSMCD